jgi:hypothetical protein
MFGESALDGKSPGNVRLRSRRKESKSNVWEFGARAVAAVASSGPVNADESKRAEGEGLWTN